MSDERFNLVYEIWKKNKVLTLVDLMKILQFGKNTIKRDLKKWNAVTSFNKNGKYYSLPEFLDFDENGLCFLNEIGFSQNGNLIKTMAALASTSAAGLSANDFEKLLRFKFNSYSVITKVVERANLNRKKFNGVYFYFSEDKKTFDKQVTQREKITVKKMPDVIAVQVLVELINDPEIDAKRISNQLKKRSIYASPEEICHFLKENNIFKKTLNAVPVD